jgi:hypothetical protein
MQTSNENEDEPSHFFLFEVRCFNWDVLRVLNELPMQGGIRPDDIVQGQLGACTAGACTVLCGVCC